MTTVDVEGPDGFAKDSGEAGEEVGEGGAGVEVADYVAACRRWKSGMRIRGVCFGEMTLNT